MEEASLSQWAIDIAHIAESLSIGNVLSALVAGTLAFFAARWSHQKHRSFVQSEHEQQRNRELTEKITLILIAEKDRIGRICKQFNSHIDDSQNAESMLREIKREVQNNELAKAYSYTVLLDEEGFTKKLLHVLSEVKSSYQQFLNYITDPSILSLNHMIAAIRLQDLENHFDALIKDTVNLHKRFETKTKKIISPTK